MTCHEGDVSTLSPPPILPVQLEDVMVGDLEEVRFVDGSMVTVRVLALDTISRPPRARVSRLDTGDSLIVTLMDTSATQPVSEDNLQQAAAGKDGAVSSNGPTLAASFTWNFRRLLSPASFASTSLPQLLRRLALGPSNTSASQTSADLENDCEAQVAPPSELRYTAQDLRERGVKVVARDVALDTAALVRNAFGRALSFVRGT